MDEIIQILVFIVTAIIFVVSAMKKKKKGVANGNQESDLANFFGLDDLIQETVKDETGLRAESVKKQAFAKPKTQHNEEEIKQTTDIKQVTDYTNDMDEDGEIFDLRSAVIYSEILNRKSF